MELECRPLRLVMYYSLLETQETVKVQVVLNEGNANEAALMHISFAPKTGNSLRCLNEKVEIIEHPEKQQNIEACSIPISKIQSELSEGQVLLPSCLVCLSRLDRSIIGFTPLTCRDLYHFCCRAQCAKLNSDCTACQAVERNDSSCTDCSSRDDLWICLVCGNVGCGRYRGGHAHDHFEQTKHAFALQIESHHVWDYLDDRYVHRTIRCAQGTVAIEETHTQSDVQEEYFSAELSFAQLESQKAFFDERLREQESYFRRIIAKQQQGHLEERNKLHQELKTLKKEQVIFNELKQKQQARYEETKRSLEACKRDLETEKLISAGLYRSNTELTEKVTGLEADCEELRDQITDLMKHLEILQLVAQTGNDPDIVNGKIITKQATKTKTRK